MKKQEKKQHNVLSQFSILNPSHSNHGSCRCRLGDGIIAIRALPTSVDSSSIFSRTGVSFTKLCDTSYDQLTRCRNCKLILTINCYIAWVALRVCCLALYRVMPCITLCVGTWELDVWTHRTNIFVKDTPGEWKIRSWRLHPDQMTMMHLRHKLTLPVQHRLWWAQ